MISSTKRPASPSRVTYRGNSPMMLSLILVLTGVASGAATQLEQHALQAFERYVTLTELRVLRHARPSGPFLYLDSLPAARRDEILADLRRGEMYMERLETRDTTEAEIEVDDALLHHWLGAVFIPGVTRQETLQLIQDYDRHSIVYGPTVEDARIVERQGDDFRIFMRLRKKKLITVVMETVHEVTYTTPAADRTYSISHTNSVREVKNAGKADETILAVGEGRGFLWRLNSYWRFLERDGGTYIECEWISLTRTVPFMLRWVIGPFVNGMPREQLSELLRTTRDALLEN